jgi:pimeloyl-ACP methyl ester carboxylesterase
MPAPDIYRTGRINPLPEESPEDLIPWQGLLFATDRLPATEQDSERFYVNSPGPRLRFGSAEIRFSGDRPGWEEARRISLLKERSHEYALTVTSVEDLGPLESGVTIFDDYPGPFADEQVAAMINEKLASSAKRDIYIYVHGYKVVFEKPMLVSSELWHFLGYDGVFMAFAWPSTPRRMAYLMDLETARYSSRNLRLLVEFLAETTDVERIHLIGYSAGTRLVLEVLAQLTHQFRDDDDETVRGEGRIGQVLLIGSDFDRLVFSGLVQDGLLRVPERLTVYLSDSDKALGLSRWLFGRGRLGQVWADDELDPSVAEFLRSTERLDMIDVSNAESATTGNGHGYFRGSPWVSSDLLMTLMFGRGPADRGLMREGDSPVWKFPPDYVDRLTEDVRRERAVTGGGEPGRGPVRD